MPWLHTFLCMVVPVTNHLVSGAVLNQAIVEWNALFKIQPNSRDFLWRLSTRWSQAFCFCFVLRVASDCGHLSLCGPFRNSSSESPLRYIGSVDAVCKSHFLHPVFPLLEVTDFFLLFWLRWGSWHMKKTFFKAANQNDRESSCEKYRCVFFHTESRWSHWSVSETTDWEKDEWVFPHCGLWLYTNDFLGFPFLLS